MLCVRNNRSRPYRRQLVPSSALSNSLVCLIVWCMEGKLSSSTTSTRNIKKKQTNKNLKPQPRIKSVIHQWWIIDNITNGHHQFHRFRFSFKKKTFLLFVFSLNFLLKDKSINTWKTNSKFSLTKLVCWANKMDLLSQKSSSESK